jgi:hypothetical protein
MNLKRLSFSLGVAGLLFSGCEERQPAVGTSTNAQGSSGNPITAPVDYLGAAAKAKQSSQKVVANVGLSQAIQHFQGVEGRFPKDLNELVAKEYVPAIPSPPVGMKYQYNPATGELKIVAQ